jgi:hypothetical protein
MSLIFATQLTAIATAVLAAFAIVTGVFAALAFRKQSREVGILAEQNDRDISDRRRDQAARVFIWAEAQAPPADQDQAVPGLIAHIKNTSQQPVYDGFIGYREGSQWIDGKERKPDLPSFPVLMPGEQQDVGIGFAAPVPDSVFWKDNSGLLTSLRFRDAAGVHWRFRSDGRLDEEPVGAPAAS